MRLIASIIVAIIAFTTLGNVAQAGGGPNSAYCGSPLGFGKADPAVIPVRTVIGQDGLPDLSYLSDYSARDLISRGLSVGRDQYTNAHGWPYSAPILAHVSPDRSLYVFRYGCGENYGFTDIHGYVLRGHQVQPIDESLVSWTISPSGRYLIVELGFDTAKTSAFLMIDHIGNMPTSDIEFGQPFLIERFSLTLNPVP